MALGVLHFEFYSLELNHRGICKDRASEREHGVQIDIPEFICPAPFNCPPPRAHQMGRTFEFSFPLISR